MQEEMTEETSEEVTQEEKPEEGGEAGDKPCWDANPGCGSGECTSICPAYVQRTPCWQFDWKSAMDGMDEMSKTELVKLVRNCSECPVYQEHPEEIKKVMSLILK
ncbi:MAG: hypothetical protein GTN38_03115 [Candidatus Aenigmarchaeota archaeon]|nr:hypothetical protein [Candidatus Aenigmarchaeota archaeon]NIP40654.1 hypothetical protein [Candidatus Aenigmarchaeota archaeon]NIQ18460.1 hypothetical protein [Candidatus Aenigmarchaeota archaeon]NIS73359.1 hypothetical protein [Candidatus Aenigmarchaeota archaeon]